MNQTQPDPSKTRAQRILKWVGTNLPTILIFLGLGILNFSLLNYIPRSSVSSERKIIYLAAPITITLLGVLLNIKSVNRLLIQLFGFSDAIHGRVPSPANQKRINNILFCLILLTVFSAFLAFRIVFNSLDYVRIYRDTNTYAAFAEKSISDITFWAGRVPFTYPLLLKILGTSRTLAGENIQRTNPLSDFQVILSIISWGLLAFIFSRSIKRKWLGALGFLTILFFGASVDISLWDRILLSESVTHSLFALLVAFWLIGIGFLLNPPKQRWLLTLYLAGLSIVTVLFSFMRDTNSYLLLAAAVLMGLFLLNKKLRQSPLFFHYIGYIMLIIFIFVLENRSSDLGRRWQTPFLNVLVERVHQQSEMLEYFVREGMPQEAELLAAQRRLSPVDYHDLVSYDPMFSTLRAWSETSGKGIFIQFLVTRPIQSIMEPLVFSNLLINGENFEYRQRKEPDPAWILEISKFFYTHNSLLLLAGILVFLFAACVLFWKRKGNLYGLIPVILLIITYPLMFIVWHGDAGEIERHSALIGISYRLAIWMMLFWILDTLAANRRLTRDK